MCADTNIVSLGQIKANLATCHRCKFRQQEFQSGVRPLCTVDDAPFQSHAEENRCPKNLFSADPGKFLDATPVAVNVVVKEWGPPLWRELHEYAANLGNADEADGWLHLFTTRLPCGDCKNHWIALCYMMPPDRTSPAAFFEWTWRVHEAVNARLGKKGITLEQAKALYRRHQ